MRSLQHSGEVIPQAVAIPAPCKICRHWAAAKHDAHARLMLVLAIPE